MKTLYKIHPSHPSLVLAILLLFVHVAGSEVTEESVRDSLLGRVPALDDHDINRDGKVDVADVLRLARLGEASMVRSAGRVARHAENSSGKFLVTFRPHIS